MNVLFINAVADDHSAKVEVGADGNLELILSGSSNLAATLSPLLSAAGVSASRVIISASQLRYQLPEADLIFNEVSEPDSHQKALRVASKLIEKLNLAVINPPASILNTRREQLSETLNFSTDLIVPKTIRCTPASPDDVIQIWQQHFTDQAAVIRSAGDHGGTSTLRLNTPEELELLHRFAYDGRDYLLSEFLDYRSSDGLYRKYRFALINGTAYLRHMIISDSWMIHSRSREYMDAHPEYYAEELHLLTEYAVEIPPALAAKLADINRRTGTDYLGLDCNLTAQGQIIVFELNANMNMFKNIKFEPWRWEQPIKNIARGLTRLIIDKLPPATQKNEH